MRKLLSILVLLTALSASAQDRAITMRDMLKQMPDTLVPFLPQNARLDFIDFIESNMKAEVNNRLDGKSELVRLTDNYALLNMSKSSQIEMRLLDTTEEIDSLRQLLCVVRSYGTDISESVVEFYSLCWRRLPTTNRVELPTEMFQANLSEREPTLSIRPECRLDAPANEEQEEIQKPLTVLNWDGTRFKEY